MYAEFHSCDISSPENISLNMSVRKKITFFLPYFSSSIGIPPGPGALLLFENFKALATSLSGTTPGSSLLHFVLGPILYILLAFSCGSFPHFYFYLSLSCVIFISVSCISPLPHFLLLIPLLLLYVNFPLNIFSFLPYILHIF